MILGRYLLVGRLLSLSILLLVSETVLWGQTAAPNVTGRVSILDFGGSGDGITDNTPALNAAIAAAMPKSLTIFFPCGRFRFASQPNAIGTGIKILGCGSTGSTVGYGTNLIADYDESSPEQGFLTWDGSFGSCCAGTGGGVEQISIFKGPARTGGTAIKLTGTSDAHRAGYSTISDVLVSSTGDGTWDHNLIIDGSCCTTLGTQGIRDTYINNFWSAQARAVDSSVLLRSAVQVFWHGGEVMPARLGQNTGLLITGGTDLTQQSANIFLSDVYIAGDLSIDNASTVLIRGYIGGNVTVAQSSANVDLAGIVGGTLANHSSTALIETNKLVSLPPGKEVVTSGVSTGVLGSTDLAGEVQLVAGKASYAFKHLYSVSPACVAQDVTAGKQVTISVSPASLSFLGFSSDVINFICVARK